MQKGVLNLPGLSHGHVSAQAGRCGQFGCYLDAEHLVGVGLICVDMRRVIKIVDHVIQVPITVQIRVSSAVAKTGHIDSPRFANVNIVWDTRLDGVSAVGDVRDFHRGNFRQQVLYRKVAAIHGVVIAEIFVRYVARKSVGDDNILATIQVKIGDQRRPAPIGGG